MDEFDLFYLILIGLPIIILMIMVIDVVNS